ncbi:4Fe-4S dicluster domain-containing protein [Desulfobacula sp.]
MEPRREQLRIDPEKCTACNRCTIACAMKHYGRVNPNLSRIKILEFHNQGLNVPVICMACENAPCINVCPVNARIRISNGSVVTNTDVCIGCKACTYICPVGSPAQNPYTGQTMTCDMCEDDETGPWCVTACQYEGALKVYEKDSLIIETARKQAGRLRRIYA